jgi:hypothetical protein
VSVVPSPSELNQALCDAAGAGDLERVHALLAAGADPSGHWDADEAKREHEAMMKDVDMSSALADLELPAELVEEMQAGIEQDQAVPSAPYGHEIPLFCAGTSGAVDVVHVLLDAGADVHRRDNASRTALYEAATVDVARLLVERGLSLEDADQLGWTPLVNAVSDGEPHRIEALLEAGADVNGTHDRGYTVFMSAASSMERDPAILERLVDAGADPHAVTELGYNAFHAAVDVNGEANGEESVRATFGCLRKLGVDLEHRNDADQTPLARAISEGTGTEVRILCEIGADPNAVCAMPVCDDDGCRTVSEPLVFAAIASSVDAEEKLAALLSAGVDLDVVDTDGRGPLPCAEARLTQLEGESPDRFTDEWIAAARRCIEILAPR